MTKSPSPTEKSKKNHDNIQNATKKFDYTSIADRPWMVSRSNSSKPHSCGQTGLRALNLPTNRNSRVINKICVKISRLVLGDLYNCVLRM